MVQIEAIGKGKSVNWRSNSFLPVDKKIFIEIGMAISPSKSTRVLYFDSNSALSTDLLANDLDFDTQA